MMPYDHTKAFGWLARLPSKWILGLSTLGPVGRLKAPGTWGSVVGLLWYTVAFAGQPAMVQALLLLTSLWLAIGICGEAEIRLGARDPSEVILDEMVCIPICFLGLGGWLDPLREEGWAWLVLLAAFGLFRLFDIVKPLGINRLQKLPSGLGVVVDDMAAALATNLCLHFGLWLLFG